MASGDEHLFSCFAIGSEGSLVSLAAVVPELIVALDRAVMANDLPGARRLHERLYELARLVYGAPGHLATLRLKTCLRLLGRLTSVTSRSPIAALTAEETEKLRFALIAAEISGQEFAAA
jgi:4-hydroxy-tetrahydrodipicolinate synthase